MIEMVEHQAAKNAPAASLEALFDRLIRVVGRTLVVKIEVRPGHSAFGRIQTGVLSWADYGDPKLKDVLRIDIGKRISDETARHTCIDLYSAVWALIDGELVPVHVPEGFEQSYGAQS